MTVYTWPQDDADWTFTPGAESDDVGSASVILGTCFAIGRPAKINAVMFYATRAWTVTPELYNDDTNTLVATGSAVACSVGWNTLPLSAPYQGAANTTYTAAVRLPAISNHKYYSTVSTSTHADLKTGPAYTAAGIMLHRWGYSDTGNVPSNDSHTWYGTMAVIDDQDIKSFPEDDTTWPHEFKANGTNFTDASPLGLSMRFDVTQDTTIRTLRAYTEGAAGATLKAEIWRKDAGPTWVLVHANTSTVTSVSQWWNYLLLDTPVSVVAGNTYYAVVRCTAGNYMYKAVTELDTSHPAYTVGPLTIPLNAQGGHYSYTTNAMTGGTSGDSDAWYNIQVVFDAPASGATTTFSGGITWAGSTFDVAVPSTTTFSGGITWAGSAWNILTPGGGTFEGGITWAGSAFNVLATAQFSGGITWAGAFSADKFLTIAEENALTGANSGEWTISGAGDTTNLGFAREFTVKAGSVINFACHGAGTVLDIYRIGYYNNLGWRKVTTLTNTATSQPNPVTISNSNGGVSCSNWSTTAYWSVPITATPGLYVGVYRNAALNNASYIPFVVRNDTFAADIVVKISEYTWGLAYNYYNTPASPLTGKSVYGSGGALGDITTRAHFAAFERPIVTRQGVPQTYWLNSEAPLIRWLERMGYNVRYVACKDVDTDGTACFAGAKMAISSGHDEYWSDNMRDTFEAIRDAGKHLLFLSGNEVFWRVRSDASLNGFWCYKDTMAGPSSHIAGTPLDPVSWTGTWKDTRWAGRKPENTLTGTDFRMNGVRDETPTFASTDAWASHPVWRNTTIASGGASIVATGTVGFEADDYLPTRPSPVKLAGATFSINGSRADDNGETYNGNGNLVWGIAAQGYPSFGIVVGFGTAQWQWLLDGTHDRGNSTPHIGIQQFMYNLLRDLGAAPATIHAGLTASSPASLLNYGLTATTVTFSGGITWQGFFRAGVEGLSTAEAEFTRLTAGGFGPGSLRDMQNKELATLPLTSITDRRYAGWIGTGSMIEKAKAGNKNWTDVDD